VGPFGAAPDDGYFSPGGREPYDRAGDTASVRHRIRLIILDAQRARHEHRGRRRPVRVSPATAGAAESGPTLT